MRFSLGLVNFKVLELPFPAPLPFDGVSIEFLDENLEVQKKFKPITTKVEAQKLTIENCIDYVHRNISLQTSDMIYEKLFKF